jgi:hypothetical protein
MNPHSPGERGLREEVRKMERPDIRVRTSGYYTDFSMPTVSPENTTAFGTYKPDGTIDIDMCPSAAQVYAPIRRTDDNRVIAEQVR